MVQFGKQLLSKRYEPWAAYYVDYQGLKTLLEPSATPSSSTTTTTTTAAFVNQLTIQIKRVVHFYLEQQGALSATLLHELEPQRRQQSLALASPESIQEDYYQAACTLLRLVHFVDLNVTGLRKILKKHDKLTGGQLSQQCFQFENNNHKLNNKSSSDLRRSNNNNNNTRAAKMERQIKDCSVLMRSLLEDADLQALYVTIRAALADIDQRNPSLQSSSAWTAGNMTERALLPNSISEHSDMENLITEATLKENGSAAPPRHVLVLLQIQAARRKLQKSSNYVKMLATTLLLETGDENDDDGMLETASQAQDKVARYQALQSQRQRTSNWLNLVSTFLHLTDYYVIAPSAGLYAERLGQTPAWAGLIIGLNSISALGSTILYSWWSTYSYKSALIFASTCQLVGALLYAAALPMNSLTLVIVGRLVGGFGSARSINRRYIADTCAVQDRTAASAAFVTAGALGTTTGPALAALLYLTVPDDSDNLYWQVETAPGWTMAVFWLIFVLSLIVYYDDPPSRKKKPSPLMQLLQSGDGARKANVDATAGERQGLLANNSNNDVSDDDKTESNDPPLWTVVPVVTTFYVYFCLKFVIESIWSSTSIVTEYYFDWTGSLAGIYLAILGLLVLPANWVIATASQRFDDRDLMIVTQIFMLWGCLAILQSADTSSLAHFIVGSVLMFVAAHALEGPNMSLLSKTIPPRYSRGFFNVGLLATESGTLGRAMGGVILTLSGSRGMEHILVNAFGIMSGLSASTIILCIVVYMSLMPDEEDDL